MFVRMDASVSLRATTRMVDALTHIDDPRAARLRAELTDATRVELRTVQEVCGLLGVSATSFITKENA